MATNADNLLKNEVGRAFVERYQHDVIGVLHGWDRLRLQGTLRSLYYPPVMEQYLRKAGVMWKDFKQFAIGLTGRVRQAAEDKAKEQQRPVIYLASSRASKEDEARQIQQRDGVKKGLIAIMSCVEPWRRWCMHGNRATKRLELSLEWGKCTHLYFYWIHEELGFLHLRLQTWFPFLIQVCVNGREWLGRQMDKAGMAYRREENCFPWISDVGRAQELMEQQQATDWPRGLGVRVKHWLNKNSLKFYDKGSVLRDEVTINEPKDFRVWRGAENKPSSKKQWRVLRRSVADFSRRAEVSRKATDRHLTALAAVEVQSSLAQEAAQVCRAVRWEGQRDRALNPFGKTDADLLAAVNRGEFAINGFRNRDVRARLYAPTQDKRQERRQMAAVGRKLRLLRGHGLIAKVSKTHRYVVTEKGRRIITALLTARQASTEKLTALAA